MKNGTNQPITKKRMPHKKVTEPVKSKIFLLLMNDE